MSDLKNEPLAVIGMACRYSGADTPDELWKLAMRREHSFSTVPVDRWDTTQPVDPEVDVPNIGAFLDDVSNFDATFFRMSPREADNVDPQQRLALELCWQALEDAGVSANSLVGTHMGVYFGAGSNDYEHVSMSLGSGVNQHTAPGLALDMIAERIAYFLGVRGPALTIQTGCSSALVALHLARQSLLAGDIDAAIVGGVNLMLDPYGYRCLTHFGALSPDGVCRPFGEGANGFVRGEGGAILFLKRASDLDQNQGCHGLIRASMINNDGGGDSIVAPSPDGQADLLEQVYQAAPDLIDALRYVECHGTGTAVGDPAEAKALGRVVAMRRRPEVGPLPIGSLKSNIGHQEAGAGLAGLVKCLASLERGQVPPTLTSERGNPEIDFEGLNLKIAREPLNLSGAPDECLAVSSFGWGGTNAHVVVSKYQSEPVSDLPRAEGAVIVPVSAHNSEALKARAMDLTEHLDQHPDELVGLAATLAWARDGFPQRAAVLAQTRGEAAEVLRLVGQPGLEDEARLISGRALDRGRTCFVFPGQGSQWHGMGVDLLERSEVFADTVRRCAVALAPEVGWDAVQALRGEIGLDWESPDVVQPLLWTVALGLFDLWQAVGVHADVVVGHSQGEIAAATAAGMLSIEDGAKVVARRSRILKKLSHRGLMLFVGSSPDQTAEQLAGFEELVSIAVVNSPSSCVIAGDSQAILLLQQLLEAQDIYCKLVNVDYASHSPQVEEVFDGIIEALAEITPRPGHIPMVSTVTGETLTGTEVDGRYWATNLRRTVQFGDTMSKLFEAHVTHVIETSPHPLLRQPLAEITQSLLEPVALLNSLHRDKGTWEDFQLAQAHAWVSGLPALGPRRQSPRISLPRYPWQREHRWLQPTAAGRASKSFTTLLPSVTELNTWTANRELSVDVIPWVVDHKVGEAVVLPGTGFLDLALQTSQQRHGLAHRCLRDVEFYSSITLSNDPIVVSLSWREEDAGSAAFTLSNLDEFTSAWTTMGRCRLTNEKFDESIPEFPVWLTQTSGIATDEVYQMSSERGINYGSRFRTITTLWHLGDEALAHAQLSSATPTQGFCGRVHPVLWDGALQAAIPLVAGTGPVVPVSIETIRLAAIDPAQSPSELYSYARMVDDRIDIDVYDAEQMPLMSIRGLAMQALEEQESTAPDQAFRLLWEDAPLMEEVSTGAVEILADETISSDLKALQNAWLAGAGTEQGAPGQPARVVYLAPTRAAGLSAQRAGLLRLAETARELAGRDTPPSLMIITRDAQCATDIDPGAALYWGFGRVIRNEYTELSVRLVDTTGVQWIDQAMAELRHDATEDEVCWQGDQRRVGVLFDVVARDVETPTHWADWQGMAQPFRLVASRIGRWDGVGFRPLYRRDLRPEEVELKVEASALNFADVLKVMGQYPGEDKQVLDIGLDAAGTIVRVGSKVDPSLVGTRVAGCAGEGAIASHLIIPANLAKPLPENLDFAQGAALPSVLATAWYGLKHVGRLQSGETVLIHSASGGLGLVAIEIARALGATVIATAGTPEKRDFLRSRGVGHVFMSRNLEWVAPVRELVGGRGVDVILNSLTGRAIEEGMALLADRGRFVEMGKKDIYSDRSFNFGLLRRGVGIASVDMARMFYETPAYFAQMLEEGWQEVLARHIDPLELRTMSFADAPTALREMSKGSHIGKFVLTDPDTVSVIEPEPLCCGRLRRDGCYVITGGLGALGFSLAQAFASRGAGQLALLARRTPSDEQQMIIETLREQGTDVVTFSVDVTDADAMREVWNQLPQVRGVVHTAGILDDATIQSLTAEQLQRVLAPKVDGALILDELSRGQALDVFVVFSSAAGLYGNPGQGAYAAANTFMDALIRRRRSEGLAGLSVAWGAFDKIGLAAEDSIRGARLASFGMLSFDVDQGWEALFRFLADGESEVCFAPLDREQFFAAYPQRASLHTMSALSDLGMSGSTGGQREMLEAIIGADPADRVGIVAEEVRRLAALVLQLEPSQIEDEAPFKVLGLDSLMGIELRNRLESSFGLKLPATLLWTFGSTGRLASELTEQLLAEYAAPESAELADVKAVN